MGSTSTQRTGEIADRRVDARRNYEQLVEGAIQVLGSNPAASLQEIAAAAGLHRATLHRHFRSREDLLAVVRRRAGLRMLAHLDAVEAEGLPPAEALAVFTRRVIEGAAPDRMWRIAAYYGPGADEHRDEITARITALLGAARDAGAIREDLSGEVLTAVWTGVTAGMFPLVHDGDLDLDEAVRVVCITLRAG